MTSVPSPLAIWRIEIFSRWVGFADPPSHSAKLTITNVGDRFVRQQALEAMGNELPRWTPHHHPVDASMHSCWR